MKNHKKILILFMFLFIYFVIPSNVLAKKETFSEKKELVCTCNGEHNASGRLVLHTLYNQYRKEYYGVDDDFYLDKWDTDYGNVDNNPSNWVSPDNNKSKFLDSFSFNSPVCPSNLVIVRYIDDRWAINWMLGGKYQGEFYSYDSKFASEASNFASEKDKSGSQTDAVLLSCNSQGSSVTAVTDENGNKQYKVVNNETGETYITDEDPASSESRGKVKYRDPASPPSFTQDVQTCESVFGTSSSEESVAWFLQKILNYIRIFGILLTIVFSALDFTKSIISSDYDSLKKSQNKMLFRCLGIVALLLLPLLINFLLGLFISGSVVDFSCGIK